MDLPNTGGKSANSSFSIRYNANNEELEEVFGACEDDPPTPQNDFSPSVQSESASPKKVDKTASIIDKYFKSIRPEKHDKEEIKTQNDTPKAKDDEKSSTQKEANSSPMKDYLNRLGKRGKDSELSTSDKDGPNETWKIFHEFKFKIAQAVEDMKSTRAADEKEKSVPRDNSVSDSEENSVIRDSDQQSVGDTDNQISSLESSIQNLSELTQPVTATVATAAEAPCGKRRNVSECSEDTQKNYPLDDNANKEEEESLMEVESGVEALEEVPLAGSAFPPSVAKDTPSDPFQRPSYFTSPLLPNASKTSINSPQTYFFTFSITFLTVVLLVSYVFVPDSLMWNGFLLGLWTVTFGGAAKAWLADYLCDGADSESYKLFKMRRTEPPVPLSYTIPSIEEHRPMKKHEGWINHYRFKEYDPYTYHINKTTTAFMKLEGCNLRISYTRTKISKKAFWDEQIENVTFHQHRLYNLTGARVILLPKGLVQKRLWSKKYPICVILNEKENVQVLEKEMSVEKRDEKEKSKCEAEATEGAHADGVKPRKKFVWRRKERDSNDTPSLRQRIRSKIHKDKKTEDASTGTDPVTIVPEKTVLYEDDFIENVLETAVKPKEDSSLEEEIESEQDREYQRIKDFLDEAEEMDAAAPAEGKEVAEGAEWSLHVKESREMHRQLYILPRTSRDKHEWYRRIRAAINEASGSPSDVGSEDGGADAAKDNDMTVFRLSDKDTIAYSARITGSAFDVAPEPVAVSWADDTLRTMDLRAHERDFWPYMYKILQGHQKYGPSTVSVGVSCSMDSQSKEQIKAAKDNTKGSKENTKAAKESTKTVKESKAKKKEKKSTGYQQSKGNSEAETDSSPLPAEIGWLNALIGRIAYDAMRNPAVVTRIQRRIQRKLNTLKLPAFMGGLVATELSLGSTPPSVALVGGPACDDRGVWLSADVRYDGGAYITLNTQLNLMQLKEKKIPLEEQLEKLCDTSIDIDLDLLHPNAEHAHGTPRKPAIYDSEVDDSAESSSDEDSGAGAAPALLDDAHSSDAVSTTESGSSTKKFLRIVDKITTSRYFQQVTDYKYVKRAMEGLSNTDIKLHLELKGLEGQLAINLPAPPHDRIWIGFRSNPRIWLKARPALGARAVRFTHITNWIEQKLCKEFEKVLVLPNMEDLLFDLMTPTPVDFE